jgi:uncharacterized protein (DUF305 family)
MEHGHEHEQHMSSSSKAGEQHAQHMKSSSKAMALELGLDAIAMYFVMYTMIVVTSDLYLNLNNVYMTAMMVSAMAVVMALTMKSMFSSPRMRAGMAIGAAAIGILSFAGMRTQAAVGDGQFLRSMIPHHSGAILMCEKANLTDPEILQLCSTIVRTQREEITKMKELLARH